MVYVLSDVHGRIDRFESILHQVDLNEDDRLYVLGDVIDRNAGGIELLFRLMRMPNATLLLGNHELMMRDCVVDGGDCELWLLNGGMTTLLEYFNLPTESMLLLWQYLKNLPVQVELRVGGTDFVLAHSTPKFLYPEEGFANRVSQTELAVWTRVERDAPLFRDQTLVFGHTPTLYYQDGQPMRIWYDGRRIGIDCGCADPNGRLACLRLDDMKEFYSAD